MLFRIRDPFPLPSLPQATGRPRGGTPPVGVPIGTVIPWSLLPGAGP